MPVILYGDTVDADAEVLAAVGDRVAASAPEVAAGAAGGVPRSEDISGNPEDEFAVP